MGAYLIFGVHTSVTFWVTISLCHPFCHQYISVYELVPNKTAICTFGQIFRRHHIKGLKTCSTHFMINSIKCKRYNIVLLNSRRLITIHTCKCKKSSKWGTGYQEPKLFHIIKSPNTHTFSTC